MLKLLILLLALSHEQQAEHQGPAVIPPATVQQVRLLTLRHHLNEGEVIKLRELYRSYELRLADAGELEADVLRRQRAREVESLIHRHQLASK